MTEAESQPGHSLILFLKFRQISGSCQLSYEGVSEWASEWSNTWMEQASEASMTKRNAAEWVVRPSGPFKMRSSVTRNKPIVTSCSQIFPLVHSPLLFSTASVCSFVTEPSRWRLLNTNLIDWSERVAHDRVELTVKNDARSHLLAWGCKIMSE